MNYIFIIQLITSFIIGGITIAGLSFIAEKVNKKIAGIILSFPTTVALGLFFLGWSHSPESVNLIANSTIIPLSLSVAFAPIYIYIGNFYEKHIQNRISLIVVTFFSSIAIWFLGSIPITIYKFSDLYISIITFFIVIISSHIYLHKQKHISIQQLTYTKQQKIGRAIFVGLIIFLVVLLGNILNPFWGGMFAIFPAALSSTLVIMHYYYGTSMLSGIMSRFPIGSISILTYIIIAKWSFPEFGFILGTIISYIGSLITSIGLSKIKYINK